jgi:starch synthase (maltosyl-transferring)
MIESRVKPSPRAASAPSSELPRDGRARVVIENVEPQVDGGRFAIKRVLGERMVVEADVFADGHDVVAAVLEFRHERESEWSKSPMQLLGNDRWSAEFTAAPLGRFVYRVAGWVDHFSTWKRDLKKRIVAGQDISVDLLIGAELLDQAAAAADRGSWREQLETYADRLRADPGRGRAPPIIDDPELSQLLFECCWSGSERTQSAEFPVIVDRPKAAFSAWYEMFPRSAGSRQEGTKKHGTLKDVEARLPYIAEMGFDVLYLPPIHPIGRAHRKGPNNAPQAQADDVGSPWGIGANDGGHNAIHSQLGTMDDFRRLVAAAQQHGIELALDIAFQASPDHPYAHQHPEWFRKRPDGSIQYAEKSAEEIPGYLSVRLRNACLAIPVARASERVSVLD